jgi:hypothetical protein
MSTSPTLLEITEPLSAAVWLSTPKKESTCQ